MEEMVLKLKPLNAEVWCAMNSLLGQWNPAIITKFWHFRNQIQAPVRTSDA
jgi:hypothetical protein